MASAKDIEARRAEQRAQRRFSAADFREQALEAQSQIASIILIGPNDGQDYVIPHPLTIDDEAQERLEAFQRGDGLDRETLLGEDGKPLKDVVGEPLTRIKEPHQIDGKILESVSARTAKAILGEEEHEKFLAAGLRSNDITLAWNYMVDEAKRRQDADPK